MSDPAVQPVTDAPRASPKLNEDWLALGIGLLFFLIALVGISGHEPFGWALKTNVWINPAKIITPISSKYAGLPAWGPLVLTFLVMAACLTGGAGLLGARVGRFLAGFTVVFFASYVCYALGNLAWIAATPDQIKKFGIRWSLNLTGEAGFIVALIAGLAVGNFMPRVAQWLREAVRPEWYIKTAIVLL